MISRGQDLRQQKSWPTKIFANEEQSLTGIFDPAPTGQASQIRAAQKIAIR
jgi:hypothetical protein